MQNLQSRSNIAVALYCTVVQQGKSLFCRGFINIGCGPCLLACPLTASLIALLHANRDESCLSGLFTPSYIMAGLIHCSKRRDSLLHMEMSCGEKGLSLGGDRQEEIIQHKEKSGWLLMTTGQLKRNPK